jgi:hypothetical protein
VFLLAEYDVRGERSGLPGYYHGLRVLLSLRFAMTRGCDTGNRIRDRDADSDSDSDTEKRCLEQLGRMQSETALYAKE